MEILKVEMDEAIYVLKKTGGPDTIVEVTMVLLVTQLEGMDSKLDQKLVMMDSMMTKDEIQTEMGLLEGGIELMIYLLLLFEILILLMVLEL